MEKRKKKRRGEEREREREGERESNICFLVLLQTSVVRVSVSRSCSSHLGSMSHPFYAVHMMEEKGKNIWDFYS
jgi:hypothetical protein